MSKVGMLFTESSGGPVYVLLKTSLGYLALNLASGNTYGGVHRTIEEAVSGLCPTGYRMDIEKSCVSGRPFQNATDNVSIPGG